MIPSGSSCWDGFEPNGFLKQAWSRFELLCIFKAPGNEEAVHGKVVIKAQLEDLVGKPGKGVTIFFTDLDDFHIFPWLVDEVSREQVDTMSAKVFQAVEAAPAADAAKGKRVLNKQGGNDDAKPKKGKIKNNSILSLFG